MALLPRDVVPCPPVAPYAVWLGGTTTHLCLWERSINLLPQAKMKTKVYNPGGANRARIAERMDTALQRRQFRPAYEKLQILSSVDSLMRSQNLNQGEAALMLQVCPSQVSRWRAAADKLAGAAVSGRDKVQLHKGPASLLDGVEEDLVAFVEEWRLKGLPVSRMSLDRKACQLSPA